MSDSVKIVVGRQCDKIKQNTKKSQLGEVKKQLLSRGRQKGCNKREYNVDIFSTGLRVAKVECKDKLRFSRGLRAFQFKSRKSGM